MIGEAIGLARRLALSAAPAVAVVLLVGCQQRATVNQPSSAGFLGERFGGPQRAAPLFNPPAARAAAPAPAETILPRPRTRPVGPGQLPPMAAFTWRPAWPAVSGRRLGEVTFYRERYYDWQSSTTSGWGYIHNYVRRSFESHRVGVMVR